MTYKIVRHYQGPGTPKRVLREGLTLQEAQEYCSDPETSSHTATGPEATQETVRHGAWFDGYYREEEAD